MIEAETLQSKRSLSLLLIEDSEDDALLVIATVKKAGYHTTFRRVENKSDLKIALESKWDAIIADHSLPSLNSEDALGLVKQKNIQTPFIIVSGDIPETTALHAMRHGTRDYIYKDNLERLIPVLERELGHTFQETHDPLTQLANRNLYRATVNDEIQRLGKNSLTALLITLNIDRFKDINEALGHHLADVLLICVSERLAYRLPANTTLARFGADQFSFFLPISCETANDVPIFKSLEAVFREPFLIENQQIYITVSIGASLYPNHAKDADGLLTKSEKALSLARKESGTACILYSEKMAGQAHRILILHSDLRSALELGQFELYYQPQVDVVNNKIVGCEALIRWNHPRFGVIPPLEFLSIAEKSGVIVDIGRWAILEACRQISHWNKTGLDIYRVAVNISTSHFKEGKIVEHVLEAIEVTNITPSMLELEITEGALLKDNESTISTLQQLKKLGIRISIDDFGTGYSSLSYLKKFPIDTLKIDKSFMMDIENDLDSAAIASTIIFLGRALRLNTIAEGVESKQQLDFLRQNGCSEAQGFYFQRPMKASHIPDYFFSFPDN
ncbi:MAG: GGDEF domain-containing response regulator [Gammaproteobacteria bacterium]|nr:GGDEF domain-containing response regulator [Gammaproteobacteria bacterium]